MKIDVENVTKRIGARDWKELKDLWLNFHPIIDFPIDSEPVSSSDIPEFQEIRKEVLDKEKRTTERSHFFLLPGIQPYVFQEAVYLFYKSLNALKSSQGDILSGFKTWSVTSAYQATYFGLRCLLDLVGLHAVRVDNVDLLVDLLPDLSVRPRKEREKSRTLFELKIQRIRQFEHWEWWELFQRVIRLCNNGPFDERLRIFLGSLDSKFFAKQRNYIIYHNVGWLFHDLKAQLIDPDFGIKKILSVEGELSYSPDEDAFTTINGYLLFGSVYRMFEELSSLSPRFALEFDVMKGCVLEANNSLYHRFNDVQ